MFSSRNPVASGFTVKSLTISSWILWVECCKIALSFPSTICWRGDCPFPVRCFWLPCQISVDHTVWVYFRVLYFVPLVLCVCVYVSTFTACITMFLWVSLKSGSAVPLHLFFSVRITLFGLFFRGGCIHFQDGFFLFLWKIPLGFDRGYTESAGGFGSCGHFNSISSSHPWTWDTFPFVFSSVSLIKFL